jgi:hypothetical protein
MKTGTYCQSCSMPIDNAEMQGTEKDGTKSNVYCKYCYQQGAFVSPNMTLDEMKTIVKEQMEKRHIDSHVIGMAISSLPHLKRWKSATAAM